MAWELQAAVAATCPQRRTSSADATDELPELETRFEDLRCRTAVVIAELDAADRTVWGELARGTTRCLADIGSYFAEIESSGDPGAVADQDRAAEETAIALLRPLIIGASQERPAQHAEELSEALARLSDQYEFLRSLHCEPESQAFDALPEEAAEYDRLLVATVAQISKSSPPVLPLNAAERATLRRRLRDVLPTSMTA